MRALSTEKTIVGGFGIALIVLCVVTGVSVWLTLSLLADLREVSARVKLLDKIGTANITMAQMATTARLYGVDRTEATYGEWEKEEEQFKKEVGEIKALTLESTTQQQRVADLMNRLDWKVQATALVEDRLKTRDDITSRYQSQRDLQDIWGVTRGTSAMRPMLNDLLDMGTEERNFLTRQNEKAKATAEAAFWTIGLAGVMALAMVGGTVAMIMRDLRARRKASEDLNKALRAAESASVAKSAFLANMSHELRTPLTSIMGYADLLMEPDISGARRLDFLQTMRRSGEHLLTLINDILDVSKIEAGRMTVEKVECRMVDVLADVDSLMRSRATEKGITFAVEYQTSIPERVETDPTRFRQILMNLVGNAVKFTDDGGVKVRVSCAQRVLEDGAAVVAGETHMMTVEVIDTGVGITDEQQKLLFQPFMQADLSTTRRFGGTGLGLSISRRLARMLNGDLTMQSEVAKGSTFTLTLPLAPVAGTAMLPAGDAGKLMARIGRNLGGTKRDLGVKVLLAEDGSENREVIMLHLRHAGCEVSSAENGEEAFDMATEAQRSGDPFDVVLMDMQMPVMDGYTATSKLRSEGYTGVVIALTAHAMREDRERCLRVGCDEYAAKPVDMPALLHMISRLSGRAGGGSVLDKLTEDPALQALTRKFCESAIKSVAGMRNMASVGAWEQLAGAAHKLSGAGGAYGFEEITREARALERLAQTPAPAEGVEEQLAHLERACQESREKFMQATGAQQ